MKKIYIVPTLIDNVEIDTTTLLQKSGYDVKTNVFRSGSTVNQETIQNMSQEDLEDMVGARERGGDYGSLW